MFGFHSNGPVAYWNPVDGTRHGLFPTSPPVPGQERDTLCGVSVTLGNPTAVDWLAPTCTECWVKAIARRDAAR